MGRQIDIDDYIAELQKDGKFVIAVLDKEDFDRVVEDMKNGGEIPKEYEPDYNELANQMEQAICDDSFEPAYWYGQLTEIIRQEDS